MLSMALDKDARAIPNCYSLCMISQLGSTMASTKAFDKVTHVDVYTNDCIIMEYGERCWIGLIIF